MPTMHAMAVGLITLLTLPAAAGGVNLANGGGPVLAHPNVKLVFWGFATTPSVDDPANEVPYLEAFFSHVGGSAWANTLTEYGVANTAPLLSGTWFDQTAPPVPDLLLRSEVVAASQHFGYNQDTVYVIATPHLRNSAYFTTLQSCGWHGSTPDSLGRPVSYVYLPYIPDAPLGACGQDSVNAGPQGALDGVSIWAGREYANTVTDPAGNAWVDSSSSKEVGDICPTPWDVSPHGQPYDAVLGGMAFAVPSLFDKALGDCTW